MAFVQSVPYTVPEFWTSRHFARASEGQSVAKIELARGYGVQPRGRLQEIENTRRG